MAPMLFRCPHCAGTFQVEPYSTEQQVHCSQCRGLVSIPAVAGAAAAPRPHPSEMAPVTQVAPVQPRLVRQRTNIDLEPDSPLAHRTADGGSDARAADDAAFGPVDSRSAEARPRAQGERHSRRPGAPVLFRIARRLMPATTKPLTSKQSERLSLELLSEHQRTQFFADHDFDFMAIDDYGRYRVNVGYFDGEVGTVIRILAQRPKTLAELRLPAVVKDLAGATKGLILLTGSASQGKTTTMTAIIDEINTNYARHVITIEDPIEYLHSNKRGLIRQRQAGRDTRDFHTGLRRGLRQNPDVISIGEMRDFETIKIALTAAETGCLVISTLHIMSIDKIIERLLSFAPAEDEGHIRYVLADTLVGVIHQELVPSRDGGKRVAAEILIVNQACKHIIRNRGTFFLRNVITTGKKFGMVSMQTSLQNLVDEGSITPETMNDVMVNYR